MSSANINRGSTLLSFLCQPLGLRIDEINYLFSKTLALFLAFIFRKFFNRSTTSATLRHTILFNIGFTLIAFCFGLSDLFYLVCFSLIIYTYVRFLPKYCYHLSLMTSFLVLSIFHLHLLIHKNIDNYTLDVTATLMIMVQKFTSLAASINDGSLSLAAFEKLQKTRKSYAIRPENVSEATFYKLSLIEFFSYIFNFMGVMAGPHNYFNEYKFFIENDGDVTNPENVKLWRLSTGKENYLVVAKKAIWGWICLLISLAVNGSMFNVNKLGDPEYIKNSSFSFLFLHYFLAGCFVGRYKFYFAWLYSEAINHAAGYGYHREKNDWSLINNVDYLQVEFGITAKQSIANWNKQSVTWLRLIVQERLPQNFNPVLKQAAVFGMSCVLG